MQPDAIIIQDATLLHQVDVLGGLKDGFILINTTRSFEEMGLVSSSKASIRAIC